MSPFDIIVHVLNFSAPALALALLLRASEALFAWRRPLVANAWVRMLVIAGVGIASLLLSLVVTGHDGKVVGYAGLVVSAATAQWLLLGGWRK